MLFNSITFIFCFLPLALAAHWLAPAKGRNLILFLFSLLFYGWCGGETTGLLLASILFNWLAGLLIGAVSENRVRKGILSLGIVVNLSVLCFYKYFTLLLKPLVEWVGFSPVGETFQNILLPIGISFYTFHSISYIVDIHRACKKPFRNPIDYGLYIALFPQLIAGPIVRFHDIADQIVSRSITWTRFSSGAERFIFGLAKKVLLADGLAVVADHVFSSPASHLQLQNTWIGIVAFGLQIYFDFSGYSDMAIGLARMFGFELLENFNYPYLANSMTDFWHRWHLSLSAWFRDYLYIPLGGNRGSVFSRYRNLLTVFALCGLWHGANWNYLLWGLYHGAFLVFEKQFKVQEWLPRPLCHAYVSIAILFGWVIFRTRDIQETFKYFCAATGISSGAKQDELMSLYLSGEFYLILLVSLLCAAGLFAFISTDWAERKFPHHMTSVVTYPSPIQSWLSQHAENFGAIRIALCVLLFVLSTSQLAITTSHPFVYFQF